MDRVLRRRSLLTALAVSGVALCISCGRASPSPSAPTTAGTSEQAPGQRGPSLQTSGPPARPPTPTIDPNEPNLFDTRSWRTNFSKRSVSFKEIQNGGPPKDGIPAIDHPKFVTAGEAAEWLRDNEPVAVVEANGTARAYPLQILIWHEIVNDIVAELPVAVTFCPLCNTTISFDRRVDGQTLDFGTTGKLRNSDLIMYDRQTETWWQQATGEAIVGDLTGKKLTMIPSLTSSFGDFRRTFGGEVLSRETGYTRSYGLNPYVGYDSLDNQSPFLFSGTPDGRLRPMERVVTVTVGEVDVAYPLSLLARQRVLHDTVGDKRIVIFYRPGVASALDRSEISASRDVGATAVFEAAHEGRPLSFRIEGDEFVDAETGSRWTLFGRAVAGPLEGKQLISVVHSVPFWFAIAAFKPNIRVYSP